MAHSQIIMQMRSKWSINVQHHSWAWDMSARVSAVFLCKMLQLNAIVRRNTCLSPKPGYIWGPFRNQKGRTKTISICFLIVREDINRNEPACVLGYEFNKVNADNTVSLVPLLLSLLQDVITFHVTCTSSSLWGNHWLYAQYIAIVLYSTIHHCQRLSLKVFSIMCLGI